MEKVELLKLSRGFPGGGGGVFDQKKKKMLSHRISEKSIQAPKNLSSLHSGFLQTRKKKGKTASRIPDFLPTMH